MAKFFEIGHIYSASEPSRFTPIKVVGRTRKMVKVHLADYPKHVWRMLIHHDADGNEYLVDSSAGPAWRDSFTYRAQWECDPETWDPIGEEVRA